MFTVSGNDRPAGILARLPRRRPAPAGAVGSPAPVTFRRCPAARYVPAGAVGPAATAAFGGSRRTGSHLRLISGTGSLISPILAVMAICEVCGNDYWMAFEVITAGQRHVFDSFECAITKLAPICERCGTRVIGHGVEIGEKIFCGAHCARSSGVREGGQVRDTIGAHPG